jgi:hypothetical protein
MNRAQNASSEGYPYRRIAAAAGAAAHQKVMTISDRNRKRFEGVGLEFIKRE